MVNYKKYSFMQVFGRICLYLMCIVLYTTKIQAQAQETPEQVVQRQLDAYNARNIEKFLATYSKDIEVYNYPNKLSMKGREQMRKVYGSMFERSKDLHCKIVNRIVLGNKVIDSESVIFDAKRPPLRAIAIYTVKDGLITRVTFVDGK